MGFFGNDTCKYYYETNSFFSTNMYCTKRSERNPERIDLSTYKLWCKDNCIKCPTFNLKDSDRWCFLTTACCEYMSKSDDCWELETLRAFRDGYMNSCEEYRLLVQEYYTIAEPIVKAINSREDAQEIWSSLYHQYILPCVQLCELGTKEDDANYQCLLLYKEMVETLKNQYL